MGAKRAGKALDSTTEHKIKDAARIVFHKKGFAATRTRDIAEASGINLALLNYYFRSKQNLFDIVMQETFQKFFASVAIVFNDAHSSLEDKIESLASRYIDLLSHEPEIPLFLMSEIRNNPGEMIGKMNIKNVVQDSIFVKQFAEAIDQGRIKPQHFLHFLMNFMGLIVFPFIASPVFKAIGNLKDESFHQLIEERKQLIPLWVNTMMKS